jgi:hypothetical protein
MAHDLNKRQYKPATQCIYCATTSDLRREHIIPFGLGGFATIPKGSCGGCAKITADFERLVLRGPMRAVRVFRALQSRRRHRNAPRNFELSATIDGVPKRLVVPLEKYPILLAFPLFGEPGFLDPGRAPTPGITIRGVHWISFGSRPEELAKQLRASELQIDHTYQPVAFARLLAKIAYAHAYAEGALTLVEDVQPLVDSILGRTDSVGMWVGTAEENPPSSLGQLHTVQIIEARGIGMLCAKVHLFSDSSAPAYGVILGKLKVAAQ